MNEQLSKMYPTIGLPTIYIQWNPLIFVTHLQYSIKTRAGTHVTKKLFF